MTKRRIYDSIEELKFAIKDNPSLLNSKIPYVVEVNGQNKYVLSGNSDQAIAAVYRELGANVKIVPLGELIKP